MVSNNLRRAVGAVQQLWFVCFITVAFAFGGCGGSEEATQEEQAQQGDAQQSTGQDKPKEEKGYDQALTNFVGNEKPAETKKQEAPPPVVAAPQPSATDKMIEDLRTENTSLKQKMVKLEEDNRNLNARVADNDSKLAAEKDRADKAELAAKAVPPTGGRRGAQVEGTSDAKMSTYEDALKAFNSKMYDDAMKSFQAMLDGGVSEDLADNCKYWIGECAFAKRKYKDAIASFTEVMKYKNSEKKADAQFMIAQANERLGNKLKAKEAYEKVVKEYPMSKNVKRSKERWAKL